MGRSQYAVPIEQWEERVGRPEAARIQRLRRRLHLALPRFGPYLSSMGKVSVARMKRRFRMITEARMHYERKAGEEGGVRRHETWRHEYLARPYLLGAPDERVADRFCDVFMNVMEIAPNGKLSPVDILADDTFTRVFTHLLEEYAHRRQLPPPAEVIERARTPLFKYFENGRPIGMELFEGYEPPSGPIIVKYGRKEFLRPMFENGDIRISSASYYNDDNHLDAVRDDELTRFFFLPTYQERMRGETSLKMDGHEQPFEDDDIALPLVVDDYYLSSFCTHIHHRMPTDFDADAAIVIRDPALFEQRLVSAFLAEHPGWKQMGGPITYYDPYRDYTSFKTPEMAKHFRYAYQKEYRIAFRNRDGHGQTYAPKFFNVGPMTGYADFLTVGSE
jgi:hypothetical protein